MARPLSIVLPSGKRASVRAHGERPTTRASAFPTLVRGVASAIESGRLEVRIDGERIGLRELRAMDVSDVHVLRDVTVRACLEPAEKESLECENCAAPLTFDSSALELEDLAERYLAEAPMPRERTYPLREAVPIPRGGKATRVRVRTVSLETALPFLRELDGDEGLSVAPSFLAGMGVVALESEDGTKRIDSPALLSKALRRASDAVWADVEAAYLDHVYPRAAVAPLVCDACGVLSEMEVPWPRELDGFARSDQPASAFLDAETFEARVEALAAPLFARPEVESVSLRVEVGPAATDVGGTAILGSYTPGDLPEGEVVLYYRTFASMWADGEFDVDAEILETLEHELEHHRNQLTGHDPLHEAEEKAADADITRVVGGEARHRRKIARGLAQEGWDIVKVLDPAVAVALAVTFAVLAWLSNWL